MKKRTYKTLKGLLSQTTFKTISLYDYLEGVIVTKNYKCINYMLSDEAMKDAQSLFSVAIWDNTSHASTIANYCGANHGIFKRVRLSIHDGKVYACYNAGQDYNHEIRLIRRLLTR